MCVEVTSCFVVSGVKDGREERKGGWNGWDDLLETRNVSGKGNERKKIKGVELKEGNRTRCVEKVNE